MNKRLVFVSTAFALALPFALSGCGNKGPLVLADDPPAAPAAVAPAVEAPATETAPPPPADGTPAH
jgi:predicted small lipoprotein YifL